MPEFVVSGFHSIHFTVTLARLKNIVRYTGDLNLNGFVNWGLKLEWVCNY